MAGKDSYHKFREWGGPRFGTKPNWIASRSQYDPIEPFPGACGDCGKPQELHISEMTYTEKVRMLDELAEDARKGAEKIQELLFFITKGIV